jgi:serine/threonine-protein kinase
MDAFFEWLSSNPIAGTTLIVSFGVIVISVTLIYLIAFFQGRSIELWPPKIGQKPDKPKKAKPRRDTQPVGPVVRRGHKVVGASGETYTIRSNFYGGATATLFQAKDEAGKEVMLKVFWRGLRPNSPSWELFEREYRIAEILAHRNIVRLFDRGLNNGYPFVVMECLNGGTLRDLLESRDHLPGREILSISRQLADAIDYAHSQGVVHRDIKPGNILFESNAFGRVALSDFGIAQILGAVSRDITAANPQFVGSPGYLAPETLTGHTIDYASDIYSFGIVLFEMIAGRVPFDEYREVYAILQAKTNQEAPDIREFRYVPQDIAYRLAGVLSRNPQVRPGSANEVLAGIEDSISSLT